MRVDPGLHKPADIVTCPVLYKPWLGRLLVTGRCLYLEPMGRGR